MPAEPSAGRQRRFGCPGVAGPVPRRALWLREALGDPDARGYPAARPRRLVPAGAALLRGTRGDPRWAAALSFRPACDCASGPLLRTLLPQVVFSPAGAKGGALPGSRYPRAQLQRAQRLAEGLARAAARSAECRAGSTWRGGDCGRSTGKWRGDRGQTPPSLSTARARLGSTLNPLTAQGERGRAGWETSWKAQTVEAELLAQTVPSPTPLGPASLVVSRSSPFLFLPSLFYSPPPQGCGRAGSGILRESKYWHLPKGTRHRGIGSIYFGREMGRARSQASRWERERRGTHWPEQKPHFSRPTGKGLRSPPTPFKFPWHIGVNGLKLTQSPDVLNKTPKLRKTLPSVLRKKQRAFRIWRMLKKTHRGRKEHMIQLPIIPSHLASVVPCSPIVTCEMRIYCAHFIGKETEAV